MRNRLKLLAISIVSIVSGLSATTLQPTAALERALNSDSELCGQIYKKAAAVQVRPEYTLAYSAPCGSYYVFNRSTGGYIIVSGEDSIYPLLAYVDSGTFSKETIAPAAEYMLEIYDKEIQSFSESGLSDAGIMEYYNEWVDIEPLMSTQWDQRIPYNMYCPVIDSRICVTGCAATAMAQVICRIGHYKGSGYRSYNGVDSNGQPVEFDYAANSFDFDKMSGDSPSYDQIARLMLACGLSVGMNYGVSESAAQNANVPYALKEHFGYDSKYTRLYTRSNFTQVKWERMIYSQLQLGRPVYYSGSNDTSGHAFVIDGYRSMGLYHINWGWGGISDGYFRLSALNPSQLGTGAGAGSFSSYQWMVPAVPPGADPGINFYDELYGSISMVNDGVYSVYYKGNGQTLRNVDIGTAIVDSNENIIAATSFWEKRDFIGSVALRNDAYSYDFSLFSLPAGDYRIYPAYRLDGMDEYYITVGFSDRQHYINLTVTADGEYIITNSSVVETRDDIRIAGILPDYDLRFGFSGAMSFYVVNNGNREYSGRIGLAMLDSTGNEVVSFRSNTSVVAAGTYGVMNADFPVFDASNTLIPAGVYSLRFVDSEGNILSDNEFHIEIKTGYPFSNWTSNENIEVTNGATIPNLLISGENWTHTPQIKTQTDHRNMSLNLAFYRPSSTSPAKTLSCFQGTIEQMNSTFPLSPFDMDVPFGSYEVCYRKNYSQISQRRPVRVGIRSDELCYLPACGSEASVAVKQSVGNPAEIVIPEKVIIDGTSLSVTAIEPDGFMGNRNLSVVEVPSSIKTIGAGAFSICPSLDQIIMYAENPPFVFRNYIAPGLHPATAFYVPASAYDKYKTLLENYNPVYTLVEEIESAAKILTEPESLINISFSPAHTAVNPAFEIIPADDLSATVALAGVASVESGKLNIEIKALREGSATFHIYPAHRSDNYSVLTVNVPEPTTSIKDIGADNDTQWPADIHTITGILVKRQATEADLHSLPHGVYILQSPAGLRKITR